MAEHILREPRRFAERAPIGVVPGDKLLQLIPVVADSGKAGGDRQASTQVGGHLKEDSASRSRTGHAAGIVEVTQGTSPIIVKLMPIHLLVRAATDAHQQPSLVGIEVCQTNLATVQIDVDFSLSHHPLSTNSTRPATLR